MNNNKKAFTLAEVMVVLGIIGVLAAILLPIANKSRPDEKVMKFKKANAVLANVIDELASSEQYNVGGDLTRKADGTDVNSATYLCESIADILTTKSVKCSSYQADYWKGIAIQPVDDSAIDDLKANFDVKCKENISAGEEIVTTDGVVIYQTSPGQHFGSNAKIDGTTPTDEKLFRDVMDVEGTDTSNGFNRIYKVICLDIDGIPANAKSTDCVNECPFGYGVRFDGKIMTGARADEWSEKSMQKKLD